MRSFLIDMNKTEILTESKASWVEQVREAALKVENVMDEFMYCIHGQRSGALVGSKAWSRVAEQLQQIKKEIFEIPNRKDRYLVDRSSEGSSRSSESGSSSRRRWQPHVEFPHESEGSYIVGTKQNEDLLLWWLTSEKAAEQPSSKIISVCGMGGLGKTTLVRRVYNNPEVKKHFECYAWVSVSQSYQVDELLRNIIKEVSGEVTAVDLHTKNSESLASILRESLKDKRYVIVLDDVWSRTAWSDLSNVFPNNSKEGSRIVLTTRDQLVASLTLETRILHLKPLRDAEAWSLFYKKAFWRDLPGTDLPTDLEIWARKILGKCQGLPLAIVALGSLLSLKERDTLQWKKFYDNLTSELSNNKMLENMTCILMLSFSDLPYRLQQCFLYCSMFPEDCILKKSSLIRLWIAEGFVEETCGLTLEEVAEEYLTELIVRNMLQVAKKDEMGRLKACRVHDLMRELALSTSKGENSCTVYARQGEDIEEKARRLSIQASIHELRPGMNLSRLRALLFFVNDVLSAASFYKLSSRLRLLRVLDLRGVPIETVPNAVFELYNLRYLSLRDTKVGDLPESVGKLQRLQTLDLRRTRVKVMPRDIVNLQDIRHLLTDCVRGPKRKRDTIIGETARSWIWNLTKLQTLKTIESGEKIAYQLWRLTHMRNLGIKKVSTIHGKMLWDSISKMEHLLHLSIAAEADQTLDLKYLSESDPLPHLKKLVLHGRLENMPPWIGGLSSLAVMRLMGCKLPAIENPIPQLQGLKNLVHLTLHKAYEGQQLCFPVKGFLLLKTMYLAELTWLSRVDMEKGALMNLQVLYLCRCSELKRAIEGIEYLPALQDLYLQEMPIELVKSLRGDHRLKRGIGWEAISKSLICQ